MIWLNSITVNEQVFRFFPSFAINKYFEISFRCDGGVCAVPMALKRLLFVSVHAVCHIFCLGRDFAGGCFVQLRSTRWNDERGSQQNRAFWCQRDGMA